MNIPLSIDRTPAQTVAALDALATVYAIGTTYLHFPYKSARRSYIQLATPTWNSMELP